MKVLITDLKARQVLSSRGEPTVEVELTLNDAYTGVSIVPSGASKGKYEAKELKDGVIQTYKGKSVYRVCKMINKELHDYLVGREFSSPAELDEFLLFLDGTKNKRRFGGNGLLGISISYLKALSAASSLETYRFIGGIDIHRFPLPMMNVINGGAHVNNSLDIQEFMIVPVGASDMEEAIRWCAEVYYSLKESLQKKGFATSVGDEGGFAPDFKTEEEALAVLSEAIYSAGYTAGKDFKISLDVAASEWKRKEGYFLPKKKRLLSGEELRDFYLEIIEKFPILSIEDPFDQEDYPSWTDFTDRVKDRLFIVGDDLFTTNENRLAMGIEKKLANSILIKPNQIGTISETLNCIELARKNGFKVIISHRSGDSEDTFVSDLAYGVNADYVKFGAPCRSERTSKYNRLLKIDSEINIKK